MHRCLLEVNSSRGVVMQINNNNETFIPDVSNMTLPKVTQNLKVMVSNDLRTKTNCRAIRRSSLLHG